MYKAVFGGEVLAKTTSFKDAFKAIFDKINETIDKNDGISLMILETAIWIENLDTGLPTFFYSARDIACDLGWLKNGKWVAE